MTSLKILSNKGDALKGITVNIPVHYSSHVFADCSTLFRLILGQKIEIDM